MNRWSISIFQAKRTGRLRGWNTKTFSGASGRSVDGSSVPAAAPVLAASVSGSPALSLPASSLPVSIDAGGAS
ncbi:hypothetical protein, partial [Qipengyuania citrea]|uniref:hypothetical protein n=1 Tax=Qipengyuania citrea TaxID=225971 RepID=UPI0032648A16